MTNADKKLLIVMLRRYEKRLLRDTCDDFDLVKDGGLSDDEWPRVAIKVNALRAPEDQVEELGTYSAMGFEVCDYLCRLIESGE